MLKVVPPDPEIGLMDSKTVKLNCLTLGELENEPIFKKKWSVLLIHNSFAVNVSFLLHLFLSDPADPYEHFAVQWSCLNFAISSISLVLHPSHGHLIIFDFSV